MAIRVEGEASMADLKDAMKEAHEAKEECKESAMDNLAGLLALMQGNRGLDLPGLLALCKEKGYDKAWGGEGMFMFVFLILFLFAGGGWGNLGNRAQQDFAHAAGMNLQDIIGLYDRLASNQTATQQGFMQLDTKICQSISETISAVRNQGDRTYDATRNVGDAVRDCCCEMGRQITALGCKVDGLYGHTSVLQERTVNAIEKNACEIETKLANLQAKMDLGFERVNCHIDNAAIAQESARKDREIAELKEQITASRVAEAAVAKMQAFALSNYKPTAGGSGGGAAS